MARLHLAPGLGGAAVTNYFVMEEKTRHCDQSAPAASRQKLFSNLIIDLVAGFRFKVYHSSNDYAGGFLGGGPRFVAAGAAGCGAACGGGALATRGGGFGFETTLGGA